MFFGKMKKKAGAKAAKKAAEPVKGTEREAASLQKSSGEPQVEMGGNMLEPASALLQLSHAAGHRQNARERDMYEGDDYPPCFADFEKAAEDHLNASRADREKGVGTDARAEVWVTPDRLQAWAVVFPAMHGGQSASSDDISEILSKKKVTAGIDEGALERLKDPKNAMRLIRIAQGQAAQNGTDGQAIPLITELDKRLRSDDKGKVDFTNLNWILNVDEGQHICEIIHPTEGVNGFDVSGKELKAKNGRPVPKVNGKCTSFTEDGKYLQADSSGQLLQQGGKFSVNEVLTIKGDVDYSTGNIKSNGTVLIQGGVKPNFVVESKQDVIVQGSVEWATIIAGHDINVTGGVTAGPDDYLQAGNDIRCRFMENGRAFCKGNAYFENLVLCQVHAEGSVYVTSGRGSIIAGTVTAMAEICVTTVGNRSYRATEVRIGETPRFRERMERCSKDLETARESIKQANSNIAKLRNSPDNLKVRQAIQSQRAMLNMANMKAENLQRKYDELAHKASEVSRGRISADMAHPNVTIAIGNQSLVLQNEARYATFILRDHEIEMRSQT